MSEAPHGNEVKAPPGGSRRFIVGNFAGIVGGFGLLLISAWVGSTIDQRQNPDEELAGLASGFAGALVGLLLVLITASSAVLWGRRRGSRVLRGVGTGMFVVLGFGGLIAGVCAVVG